jgi:nitroreductase
MRDGSDMKVSAGTPAAPGETPAASEQCLDMLERRRSVTPLRLAEPGPNAQELRRLLAIALRVPDHGALKPWRLILVQGPAREELAGKLAAAFLESDAQRQSAGADLATRKIRTMLTAAPLVVIVVSRADAATHIPEWEQVLSAGAVCMNLMNAVSGLGYGAIWLSGWAAYDPAALEILGLASDEKVAGIIPIGTPIEGPQDRPRPALDEFVTVWGAA